MTQSLPPSFFNNLYKTLEPAVDIPVIGILPAAAQGLLAIVETITGLAILLISAPFHFLMKATCQPNNSIRKFIDGIYFSAANEEFAGIAMLTRSLIKIVTLSLARFDCNYSSLKTQYLKNLSATRHLIYRTNHPI